MKKLNYTELAKLVERAKEGDRIAFGAIYAATYEAQYYLALQILRNPEDAEDALQETYIRLYNSLNRIETPQAMISYLNKINYNQCLTMKERAARLAAYSSDVDFSLLRDNNPENDPVTHLENKMEADQLSSLLQSMPEHLRVILILRYVEHLKLKEIASVLEISLSTVKRHIKTAQKTLSKLIKESKGGILVAFLLNKEILQMFAESQARLAPSGQTAGNILNHTFSSLSLKDISFASCKREAAAAQIPQHSAVLKTAAAVAATGTAIAGGAYASQNIGIQIQTSHSLEDRSYINTSVTASVEVDSPLPVTDFSVYGPGSEKLSFTQKADGSYMFTAAHNGSYTIYAVNALHTAQKTLKISCIDEKAPQLLDYRITEGDSIAVYFEDDLSGIDWSRTVLKGPDGSDIPYKFDSNNNCIIFAYTTDTLQLTVYDQAGNALKNKVYTDFTQLQQ